MTDGHVEPPTAGRPLPAGHVAAVLAAGAGRRFDPVRPKLLEQWRGRPLIAWAVDHVTAAGFCSVAVVCGAVDLTDTLPPSVTVVRNAAWSDGQATSLQAAVAWARSEGAAVLTVGLGDQPLVPPAAWRRVACAGSPIAFARFGTTRCPPVRVDRSVWPLLPTAGDVGARELVAGRPDLVTVVDCPGVGDDVDTPDDLARLDRSTVEPTEAAVHRGAVWC